MIFAIYRDGFGMIFATYRDGFGMIFAMSSHDNENQEKDNENQEQDWQCRRGCDRPSRARGYVYKIGSMQSPVHEVRATPRLLVNETN